MLFIWKIRQLIVQSECFHANIFYNYNLKVIVRQLMGNTTHQKPTPLVKNWVKVDNSTYRNAITEELIDEHLIQYSSEENMQNSHTQLVSRANINHPNIIKLIYFCNDSQNNCCTDKTYRHRVFIQHPNQQLSHYLNAPKDTGSNNECFCCPIANSFAYLSERYGYFHVKDSMIFLLSQIKWHKSYDKKTVKVWINSQLQENRPESLCRQQEMVRNLKDIYDKITHAGLCYKLDNLQVTQDMKLVQFLQEIYRAHNNVFQRVQSRKKVLSTYTSSNPNILNINPSQQMLKLIQTNKLGSKYLQPNNTARNMNRTLEVDRKIDEIETIKKTVPSSTRKVMVADNGIKQQQISPFYRPQQSSKINFAYNDTFSTPKQTKVIQSLNSSSPCLPINHQQSASKQINSNKQNESITFLGQSQKLSKKDSLKAPRLQRMTVNLMVSCQSPPKESNEQFLRQSEQLLTYKLAQILESEEHIVSSPFLAGVQTVPIYQRCAQSINQSYYERQRQISNQSSSAQQEQILHYEYENQASETNIEANQPFNEPYVFQQPNIPLSQSIRESEKSDKEQQPLPSQYFTSFEKQTANEVNDEKQMHKIPNFGSISNPPLLLHTSKQDNSSKKSMSNSHPYQPYSSASHSQSEYSRLDNNYNTYLKKFNQVMNPISPRSKFSGRQQPFDSMPSHQFGNNNIPERFQKKTFSKYNSLNLEQGTSRQKSRSRGNEIDMSAGRHNAIQSGQLQSLYNESMNSEQEKKARIMEKIENTEKIIRQNRKKLEKIELEKDLQRQKEMIKKQMQSLLKNNLMSDESNRIKQKVKYKKATFAELKAQASKILEDLNF